VKRKTYVTFFYRGLFVDDTSSRPADSRDPHRVDVPDGAFAFQFFDRVEGEADGVPVRSGALDRSPMYYVGAKVHTLDEVRATVPDSRILVSNMEGNGWDRVIQTRAGNWKPLGDGDVLLGDAAGG
jgi:hypothetical protein